MSKQPFYHEVDLFFSLDSKSSKKSDLEKLFERCLQKEFPKIYVKNSSEFRFQPDLILKEKNAVQIGFNWIFTCTDKIDEENFIQFIEDSLKKNMKQYIENSLEIVFFESEPGNPMDI